MTSTHGLEQTTERILCFAAAFRIRGVQTLLGLLRETGYSTCRQELTLATLEAAIRSRPGVIDTWLLYAAEKPESAGWFFYGGHSHGYTVGSGKWSLEGYVHTHDAAHACACFILGELDAIEHAPVGRHAMAC